MGEVGIKPTVEGGEKTDARRLDRGATFRGARRRQVDRFFAENGFASGCQRMDLVVVQRGRSGDNHGVDVVGLNDRFCGSDLGACTGGELFGGGRNCIRDGCKARRSDARKAKGVDLSDPAASQKSDGNHCVILFSRRPDRAEHGARLS